jgi:hypothetical protein
MRNVHRNRLRQASGGRGSDSESDSDSDGELGMGWGGNPGEALVPSTPAQVRRLAQTIVCLRPCFGLQCAITEKDCVTRVYI